MTPTFSLIGKAFETYFKKENFIYLTKIVLVQLLIGVGSAIPFFILSFVFGGLSFAGAMADSETNPALLLILAPITVVITLALVLFGVWLAATTTVSVSHVVMNKQIGVGQTLKLAWEKVGKYFLSGLLSALIVLVGGLFFIIPGIIFSIWFSFSSFFVIEGSGVVESLKKSKALVKGHFWRVVFRYIVFAILSFAVNIVMSFVPVLGTIALVIFTPFYVLLSYLLFEDLKKLRQA